jgi:serine/threonine protein kinase
MDHAEERFAAVNRQICEAVDFLHSQDIVHGDIKPDVSWDEY